MPIDQRKSQQVAFEHGFPAVMTSPDRSWQRACRMDNVSEDGARLTLEEPAEGLDLKEFILLLSANGQAFRRCALDWAQGFEKGREIGVRFVRTRARGAAEAPRSSAPPSVVEI